MSKHIVHVIRKDGGHHQTAFEGWEAESCADKVRRDSIASGKNIAVIQMHGDSVRCVWTVQEDGE